MKSLKSLIIAGGVSLAALVASPFVSAQTWNFDSDAQGWFINDLPGTGVYSPSVGTFAVTWHSTGGNPGGYISGLDPSGNSFFLAAPVASLGNYSSYLGGMLNFSLTTDQSVDWTADNVVIFQGGSSDKLIVSEIALPTNAWSAYSIWLDASQFHYGNKSGAVVTPGDFSDILGNLQAFMIDGEWHSGVSENTGVDSISFAAPVVVTPGAVPEASTYGLFAAAILVGAVAWKRYRR